LSFAISYFVAEYFYAVEQHAHSELSAAFSVTRWDQNAPSQITDSASSDILQKIEVEIENPYLEKWWEVRLVDGYYYKWVKKTFFSEKSEFSSLHMKWRGSNNRGN